MRILLTLLTLLVIAPLTAHSQQPLPKVVLIGDSIRLGYAPLVAKKLTGQVEIVSIEPNGADSKNLLAHVQEWFIDPKPVIIHFNCGLHDLKFSKATQTHQVSLTQYDANLRAILAKLKEAGQTRIVFANTTPIIDERHAMRKANFDRFEADVLKFNDVAGKVMRENNIVVHDLHGIVEKAGTAEMLGKDGTHYTPAGYDRLADSVADCIRRQLAIHNPTPLAPIIGTPEDVKKYRDAEAANDAVVPKFFREFKSPVFNVPASKDEWTKRRPDLLKTVTRSLGDLPARPNPLKSRLISLEQRTGYRVEKIAIDNGEGNEVTTLLLIPDKRTKPAPAILWLHSSSRDQNDVLTPNRNGGEEPLGEAFVKAGYVVLAVDAWWHGDRVGTGPGGSKETGNNEQQSLMKYHLWLGRTLWGMYVRDDQIALDYLCSRSEVDAKRIGTTGMSMGSTRAWWLAAVDDRIACTVGVACLTRYENLIRHGQLRAHGVYYFVDGLLKHTDTEGVIALIAPRPYLALTGELDAGSPADGIRVIEDKAGGVYRVLGATDAFRSVRYPELGHVHPPTMRDETMKWFAKWLKPN